MSIIRINILFVLIISTCFFSCNGQIKSGNKTHVINTSELGNQQVKLDEQIWAVFQDKKGNYWYGSNGRGLYSFDGKKLLLFTTDDGLPSNSIRGIQEDHMGNVFVETPNGVSKYNGVSFTSIDIIRSTDNEWLLEPNDLWFNCNAEANHVYRYDGENMYELQLPKQSIKETLGIDENETSYSPYTVFGIDKDKNGNLWLGTVLAGAFRYDGESFLWIGEKELSRLPDRREPGVRSMIEDRDGYMWLSNLISKYKINPSVPQNYTKLKAVENSNDIIKDKLPYFNSGLVDSNGNLWMTTYGGGVWKYDGESLSNFEINNEIETVLLISIYADRNGTLWLGTNNDGVYKQNGDGFEKYDPK